MAKSRFEYVREFEENDAVMKQCYIGRSNQINPFDDR
jgi:hypothetical protein